MDFILPIFPQGSLDSSVFTTVWLGVCVTVFFNLRLGWVLSGLVVPGYIVPLLLNRPWSVGVIFVEALLTYLLVWFYSEVLSRWGGWDNFFGRDRFFALLLASVLVRLLLEALVLPQVGAYLTQELGLNFNYRDNLHSFGLIVVALIANQFWKPGIRRGVIPLLVIIVVTWFLVRYGLMEFTNFSMGNLTYMYEDLAASMLASPKAYIILLATALIASRMNLHYGWEYNGILIPSLLALQWYQPLKLVASFAEAFMILGVAHLVLQLPFFKKITMEGGRKILLFFNISFIYKIGLAYLILWLFPEYKISNYYAFGYLLPSLLAIKMHDKQIMGQVFRATAQTSLIAVILAGGIGFALNYVPNYFALSMQKDVQAQGAGPTVQEGRGKSLIELVRREKVALYQSRDQGYFQVPLPRELEMFQQALRNLKKYVGSKKPELLDSAGRLLQKLNYKILWVQDQYLYLAEQPPRRGWGTFVLNTRVENGLAVEVPAPLQEWGVMQSGTWLFTALKGRALAIAGAGRGSAPGQNADVLRSQRTLFHIFHQVFKQGNVLQVRGYTESTIRSLYGRRGTRDIAGSDLKSSLWIQSALPQGLDLSLLKSLLGKFAINWGKTPFTNILRQSSGAGFAELFLSRTDRRKLFFKPRFVQEQVPEEKSEKNIVGYLQDYLLKGKDWLAEKGSNAYKPPELEELLFMDGEVLTPLSQVMDREYLNGSWTEEGLQELKAIRSAARILDYELIRYQHTLTGRDYLILTESKNAGQRKYWGTYVFLLGSAHDYILEIPRPLYEVHIFEFGVHLFERLQAKALLISGTHPAANLDQSADLVQQANKQNLFNLTAQVLLREAGPRPMTVLHLRGFGYREEAPPPESDLLMAFKSGLGTRKNLGPQGERILDVLESEGLQVRFVDGQNDVTGYEVGGLPQADYLEQTVNKRFALLWLSPLARGSYRQQEENKLQQEQFAALNIDSKQLSVSELILEDLLPMQGISAKEDELRSLVSKYISNEDIIYLRSLQKKARGYKLLRAIDINSKQAFLLLMDKGRLVFAANLIPKSKESVRIAADAKRQILEEKIEYFVNSGAAWLLRDGKI